MLTSTLIDRVWGDNVPVDVRNVLYSYVSRLRGVLSKVDPANGRGMLRRSAGGYLLDVPPDRVDLHRSRNLVAQARQYAAADAPDRAMGLFEEASGLWRGTPLAGLTGAWAERVRSGLEQERLAILTDRYDTELRLGRHSAAVSGLWDLLAAHPLAESVAALLMRALYRSGHPADALDVYAQVRRRMVEEMGDEPGPELRDLHQQVLRRSVPAAVWTPPASDTLPSGGVPTSLPTPAQLPPDIPGFAGRDDALRALDALLPDPASPAPPTAIVAVVGTAGVGKTALAVHWGHRIRDRFPDGQLFVNLHGYGPGTPLRPIDVLARFLRTLGVPPQAIPADKEEAAAVYRSLVAGRRMLLVLDNAVSAEQVRPLIPGTGWLVVVTSRSQLAGLVAQDGSHSVSVETLSPPESVALLTLLVGPDRVAAEPREIDELAALCGHLPLALRIAGAKLGTRPHQQVRSYLTLLRDGDRLGALAVPGEGGCAVRAAFAASYLRLPDDARRLFRLLGLVPGPSVTPDVAAALGDVPLTHASGLLDLLASIHLIEECAEGRYVLHDLLRCYAIERLEADGAGGERAAAAERLYRHYLATADAAARLIDPNGLRLPPAAPPAPGSPGNPGGPRRAEHPPVTDRGAASGWFDRERDNLVAAVVGAAAHGPRPYAWQLTDALRSYLLLRAYTTELGTVAEAALRAARASGEARAEALALLCLTDLHRQVGNYPEALDAAKGALTASQRAGWLDGEGSALSRLGLVSWQSNQLDGAIDHYTTALDRHQTTGWRHGVAVTLANLAGAYLVRGDLERAADYAERSCDAAAAIGSRRGEAVGQGNLAEALRWQGRFETALQHMSEAHQIFRELGDDTGTANALRGLAAIHGARGELDLALELATTGLAHAQQCRHRALQADAGNQIAALHHALGHHLTAVDGHLTSIRHARDAGNRYVESEALIGLARAHRSLRDHRTAATHAADALAIARDAGYRLLEGEALTALAGAKLAGGDEAAAVACGQAGLAVHRASGNRLGQARTLLVLGRAFACAGREAEGRDHQHRADALFAELGMPGGEVPAAS